MWSHKKQNLNRVSVVVFFFFFLSPASSDTKPFPHDDDDTFTPLAAVTSVIISSLLSPLAGVCVFFSVCEEKQGHTAGCLILSAVCYSLRNPGPSGAAHTCRGHTSQNIVFCPNSQNSPTHLLHTLLLTLFPSSIIHTKLLNKLCDIHIKYLKAAAVHNGCSTNLSMYTWKWQNGIMFSPQIISLKNILIWSERESKKEERVGLQSCW